MTEGYSSKLPFPHLIIKNVYDESELELIWQELNFLTSPWKLQDPADFKGAWQPGPNGEKNYVTNSKALVLDAVYSDRNFSDILTVNRKLFTESYLRIFSEIEPYLAAARESNWDQTKIRYYGNGTKYDPHQDNMYVCLAISFFHKQPKRFKGGELYFPDHDFSYDCEDNSMIIFPGFVTHAVAEVQCDEQPFEGFSRYSMTQFLGSYPSMSQ